MESAKINIVDQSDFIWISLIRNGDQRALKFVNKYPRVIDEIMGRDFQQIFKQQLTSIIEIFSKQAKEFVEADERQFKHFPQITEIVDEIVKDNEG